MNLNHNMCSEIALLKLLPYFPGASELKHLSLWQVLDKKNYNRHNTIQVRRICAAWYVMYGTEQTIYMVKRVR